jgi:hypothetical protein
MNVVPPKPVGLSTPPAPGHMPQGVVEGGSSSGQVGQSGSIKDLDTVPTGKKPDGPPTPAKAKVPTKPPNAAWLGSPFKGQPKLNPPKKSAMHLPLVGNLQLPNPIESAKSFVTGLGDAASDELERQVNRPVAIAPHMMVRDLRVLPGNLPQ